MSIVEILRHTPGWVWLLLRARLTLGLTQSVARRMTLQWATIPPLALCAASLAGVVTALRGAGLAAIAWAVGGAMALALARRAGLWRGIGPSDGDGRLLVPGSWAPLALIVGLFCIRFGVGVALATQPGLGAQWPFAGAVAAVYGLFSGSFVSRARAAWTAVRGGLRGRPMRIAASVVR